MLHFAQHDIPADSQTDDAAFLSLTNVNSNTGRETILRLKNHNAAEAGDVAPASPINELATCIPDQ